MLLVQFNNYKVYFNNKRNTLYFLNFVRQEEENLVADVFMEKVKGGELLESL